MNVPRQAWPEPPTPHVPERSPDAILPIADLLAWSEIAATPKQFIMAGFVPAREVTLLTGAGGANKSTFGQQLATCSAAGLPMLGADVLPGKALYVTCEDDEDRLQWIQEHICRALGVELADLDGKLFLASLRGRQGNELATFDNGGRLRPEPLYRALRVTIEATGVDRVVLDNVAHLFVGNENDRGQVTAFVNLLYSLCAEFGVTVVLIGHPNKAGDSYSGSTAWLNAVRSQIVIERPEGAIDPDVRVARVGKANYARPGETLAFRWHDFALVRDEDLPANLVAEIAEVAAINADDDVFLACLDARIRDGLIVSPNVSPNYAPTQFEAMPAARGIGRVRLRSAMERLLAIDRIEVFDHENKGKGRSLKAIRRAPRTSPDVFPDASRTGSRTFPEPTPHQTPNHPAHTLPPKGGIGAPPEAAAPSLSEQLATMPDKPHLATKWIDR